MARRPRLRWPQYTLLAWVLVVRAALGEPAPTLADSLNDPAALAAFLDSCAARLSANDEGLARVARRCPGVEVAIAHGPLADSLRAPHWPANIDAQSLRSFAALARTAVAAAPPPYDRAALDRELARLRAEDVEHLSWWQRWLARIDDFLTSPSGSLPVPEWLRSLAAKLELSAASLRWAWLSLVAVALALALGLILFELRATGSLRRMLRAVSRRSRSALPQLAPRPGAAETRAVATLSGAFADCLAALERRGLLTGARSLTCAEVGLRSGQVHGLEPLAGVAQLAEAYRYARRAPSEASIVAAMTTLRALAATSALGAAG